MTPFLCINLTDDKKNEQYNGEEFLVTKTPIDLSEAFDKSTEKVIDTMEQSKLPLFIRIMQWIFGMAGAVLSIGLLGALTDEDGVSFAQAYENAGWIFWIAGGSLVIWGILAIWANNKRKSIMESPESNYTLSTLDTISENILNELSVPSEAPWVDILAFRYKIRNGIPKPVEGLSLTPYNNFTFKVFRDSTKLYLANMDGKYEFLISGIYAIRTVKKNIAIPSWNKEIPFNKGEYKQYKLYADQYDCIHFKTYHILEIEHEGELWGIYFPNYELPIFKKLTGVVAE